MNIIKKLFFVGLLAALPCASVLSYDLPRVAVGWVGNGVPRGLALYNSLTGEKLLEQTSNATPAYMSFLSPFSNSLVVNFNTNNLWVYNQDSEIVASEPATQTPMTSCLLVKNGDAYNIVASAQDGSINAYDSATGKVVITFELTGHIGVSSLAMYQQDGKPFLVAGTVAGFIDIYDYQTGVCVRSINTYENDGFYNPSWIDTVVVFQDGDAIKIIASTANTPQGMSGQLGCWDATTGAKEYVVWYCDNVDPKKINQGDIYSLQLYKDVDGKLKLITSAIDPQGLIKIWDPLTGAVIQSLSDERFSNTSTVCVRAFEGEDEIDENEIVKVTKLVAGYGSGEIAVWNTRTGLVEAYVNQNANIPRFVSALVRFITLFTVKGVRYCTVGNDNGDLFTYKLDTLECIMNWSIGQGNIVWALANPQELLADPAKSQYGFFSLMLGCYMPYVDLDDLVVISA